MIMYLFFFFFPIPLCFSATPLIVDTRFIRSIPHSLHHNQSQQYFELTRPLPSDHLTPSCSLLALSHHFANTLGEPPVSVPYSPPSDCLTPWLHVVLEFRATCKGEQYDRIAGVWLDGVELLRTSTAEPTESGIAWKVRKDVTRYSSLLSQTNLTLYVMLENIVNDVYTGIYHVNLTFFYYRTNTIRVPLSSQLSLPDRHKRIGKLGLVSNHEIESKLGFENNLIVYGEGSDGAYKEKKMSNVYEKPANFVDDPETDSELGVENQVIMCKEGSDCLYTDRSSENLHEKSMSNQKSSLNLLEVPADLIIPISGTPDEGFWFRIQGEKDVHSKGIQLPSNAFKAVLEVYVSFHGNDEFWYSNPPDSYIRMNNLTTGRGHGAYREVFVTVDGNLVGFVVPFPVIFTGGINPLFWEPVVAIGAFNVPSYDIDLTPFLGIILDGKVHSFRLGVADSIQFWLVDANLHLWLDHSSSKVQAKAVDYLAPATWIKRNSVFEQLDGLFNIKAVTKIQLSGWVNSTAGNLTTHVLQKFKFRNLIKFVKNGTYKSVTQKVAIKIEVRVESDMGKLITSSIMKREYPLNITISTLPGKEDDAYLMITNVSNALRETWSDGKKSSGSIINSQECNGWMLVKDHSVLSGSATTHQVYNYTDENGCYSRIVEAANGMLVNDFSFDCASST